LSSEISVSPRLAPRTAAISSDPSGDNGVADHPRADRAGIDGAGQEAPGQGSTTGRLRRALAAPVHLVGRLPGIAVLLPMALGATIATFAPHDVAFGPFTTALTANAAMPAIALLLVAVGAQISLRSAVPVSSRIGVVLLGSTLIPGILVFAYAWYFGPAGIGGIPLLTVVAAALCTSNGLWLTLAQRYGSPEDAYGGTIAAAINSGPLVPLLLLAAYDRGQSPIPWSALLDSVTPLLIGLLAGMLWPPVRPVLRAIIPVMIVTFSFSLGLRLPFTTLAHQLVRGSGVGIACSVLSGMLVALGWVKLLRGKARIGWAASAITVGAGIVPAMIGAADPAFRPYVMVATAQVSVAVLVSTVLTPILVLLAAHWPFRHRHPDPVPVQAKPDGERKLAVVA
jgi:2-keto-3-deoxygluconate permease